MLLASYSNFSPFLSGGHTPLCLGFLQRLHVAKPHLRQVAIGPFRLVRGINAAQPGLAQYIGLGVDRSTILAFSFVTNCVGRYGATRSIGAGSLMQHMKSLLPARACWRALAR